MHRFLRTASALALTGLLAVAALPAAADGPSKLSGVVNINTATLEELQLLPGIGAARAQAVVDARKTRGGFRKLEDLLEVKGIGDTSLARLRPHVALQGKTTAQLE